MIIESEVYLKSFPLFLKDIEVRLVRILADPCFFSTDWRWHVLDGFLVLIRNIGGSGVFKEVNTDLERVFRWFLEKFIPVLKIKIGQLDPNSVFSFFVRQRDRILATNEGC